MRFALTEEQADLAAVVRELLSDACPPELIRRVADEGPGAGEALHGALADLGAYGLLVAEDQGGLGMDENSLVPILTETGRAAVPLPLVDTIAVAPGVLAACGRVDELATGELVCAASPGHDDPVSVSRAALLLRGGFGGVGAIEVIPMPGGADLEGVDPAASLRAIEGRPEAVIDDPSVVQTAWLRGVLGTSAELVGLGHRMIEITVGYVKERTQFGVPIGSFQAVKHHLADALLTIESAAPVVASAGAMLAADPASPRAAAEVSAAKVLASESACRVARLAIQCHGAMGYTTEYDLHLFVKRAWRQAALWGSAGWHRDAVARYLELPDPVVTPAR